MRELLFQRTCLEMEWVLAVVGEGVLAVRVEVHVVYSAKRATCH